MNQEPRKRNATKHYQNSDYPSGSFEAAIRGDHEARLREGTGLRLERHPSLENSAADLDEEMVPAHMHRDFFRSEEDAVQGVPVAPRLRRRTDPPASYVEPPRTEDDYEDFDNALEKTLSVGPLPDPRPEPKVERRAPAPAPVRAAVAEPIPPLRSGDSAPAPEAPPRPAPQAAPVELPAHEVPREQGGSPQPAARQNSPYSIPMLIALAAVMALFVWREQTRPVVASEPPLPVPQTVQTAAPSATPLAEPRQAEAGFRPTFMAVGPPVPVAETEAGATPLPSEDDPAALMPGGDETAAPAEAEVDEAEAADRAAVLERMSQMESSSSSTASSPDPADLFPEAEPQPKPAAPVRAKGDRPAAAASAPPAVKPAAKPDPVAASAADLFPIDEEVPVRPAAKPAAKPAPAAATAASVPTAPAQPAPSQQSLDGYQIDEPNL